MAFLNARFKKALKQEAEREQRNEMLTHVAEEMRKRGASKSSMRRVLPVFNEYFILLKKPIKSESPVPTPVPNAEAPGILLSEVETQAVAWLWERRIPLGKITILDGDPGMGKSLIATQIAACVSTGRPMPDGTPGKQGGVILIAPEDSAEDTLKPRDENKRILATTKNNLSKQASNLTYQVVENEQRVPYIQWLGENHHPVKALFSNANLSYERQSVLRVLKDSIAPLSPREVAERTGLDYENVRKMLPRLLHAGEIASPARGHYTALGHPSLAKHLKDNTVVPTETYVPTMTIVPNIPSQVQSVSS